MGLLHSPAPGALPHLLAQCLRKPVATCPKGCRAGRKSSHWLSSFNWGSNPSSALTSRVAEGKSLPLEPRLLAGPHGASHHSSQRPP